MMTESKQRAATKYIKVTYPDGQSICYKNVTMTFMEVLRRLSVEQLQNINLQLCHLPLITQEKYAQYEKYMKTIVRGWYVNTQTDSSGKYMQLRSINDQLNLGLKIEIGEDLEATNIRGFNKEHKKKDDLLVKFPDGTYIGEENPKATYIACVRKMGTDVIQRKSLQFMEKNLITSLKMYNDQIELKEEKLWLLIPPTTKLKYRALSSIALYLHLDISISII